MNAKSYHILLFQPASLKYLQVLLYHIYSVFPYPSLRIRHLHDDVPHGGDDGRVRSHSHILHHDRDDVHGRGHHGHVLSLIHI